MKSLLMWLSAGMNVYVSKPFNVNAFKGILSQWISFPETPEQ